MSRFRAPAPMPPDSWVRDVRVPIGARPATEYKFARRETVLVYRPAPRPLSLLHLERQRCEKSLPPAPRCSFPLSYPPRAATQRNLATPPLLSSDQVLVLEILSEPPETRWSYRSRRWAWQSQSRERRFHLRSPRRRSAN